MTVQMLTVTEDEGEQRLDKWLRRRFPQLNQVAVEKLCRTGQIRVDSGRVKASDRVMPGQTVRVPPLPDAAPRTEASMYSSKLLPRRPSSIGISRGSCQPTVRRPVVDMIETRLRTRAGFLIATVWAIMPAIETPTTWARSISRWSRRPTASSPS